MDVALRAGSGGRVAVVAATSQPSAVDPALRRHGRLDQDILVGLPELQVRAAARLPPDADRPVLCS